MSSINWSAPNIWFFIAQLVEHYSANAEALDSNPVDTFYFLGAKTCNCLNSKYNCDKHISFSPVFLSSNQLATFHVSFPVTGKDELDKLVCSNIWVFIAQLQLVEHCSANVEAMGSNPVDALKIFSGSNLQLLKLQAQLRWSHLHFKCIPAVQNNFI